LKENVIIGKLIPAGTGLKRYMDISLKVVEEPAENA
jgi:DNA-directed RNA polymerase subunit beta'